jgi:hypothetical protein
VDLLVDIEIVVAVGQYSLDIHLEDTDALSVPDTLHHLATHLEQMQRLPAVKKAMSTPIKVDDLD